MPYELLGPYLVELQVEGVLGKEHGTSVAHCERSAPSATACLRTAALFVARVAACL